MNLMGLAMLTFISDIDIVTACVTLEEHRTDGMTAIVNVINNRARGDAKKFKRVVLQKYQFSCMNDHTVKGKSLRSIVKKAKTRSNWQTAKSLVKTAMAGKLKDTSDGATHYHVYAGKLKCSPSWTHPSLGGRNRKCKITKFIGTHAFLKGVD